MKGNPFKLKYAKDGSLRIYYKREEHETVEKQIKEEYFAQKGIKNLDELRPDGYKNGFWYEVKVGSESKIGKDWIQGSKYFPGLFFPLYYFTAERDIDSQVENYISYGYCPLKVLVFDYSTHKLLKCITIGCDKHISECKGDEV